jgi:hypothetical protein
MWDPGVSGVERLGRYQFSSIPSWAVGSFGGWADLVPLASFLFFVFFSFSFFDLPFLLLLLQ